MAFNLPDFGNLGGGVGNFINIFNVWFGKFQSMSQLDWFGLITVGLGIVNIILPVVFILNDMSKVKRSRMGR